MFLRGYLLKKWCLLKDMNLDFNSLHKKVIIHAPKNDFHA